MVLNKSNLGANAILGVFGLLPKLLPNELGLPLYDMLVVFLQMPLPVMNINGGLILMRLLHFRIYDFPSKSDFFSHAIQMGEIFIA
jgi:enolase